MSVHPVIGVNSKHFKPSAYFPAPQLVQEVTPANVHDTVPVHTSAATVLHAGHAPH